MGHVTVADRPVDRTANARRIATAKLAIRRAARLGAGVALGLTGLAVTGGSFGLFAVIGIPITAVGLSLISAEVNRDGPATAPGPLVISPTEGPAERSATGAPTRLDPRPRAAVRPAATAA